MALEAEKFLDTYKISIQKNDGRILEISVCPEVAAGMAVSELVHMLEFQLSRPKSDKEIQDLVDWLESGE